MFVFSNEQFKTLTGMEDACMNRSMLDLGAGDGMVTANMARHFRSVHVTESSSSMRMRLGQKGYTYVYVLYLFRELLLRLYCCVAMKIFRMIFHLQQIFTFYPTTAFGCTPRSQRVLSCCGNSTLNIFITALCDMIYSCCYWYGSRSSAGWFHVFSRIKAVRLYFQDILLWKFSHSVHPDFKSHGDIRFIVCLSRIKTAALLADWDRPFRFQFELTFEKFLLLRWFANFVWKEGSTPLSFIAKFLTPFYAIQHHC